MKVDIAALNQNRPSHLNERSWPYPRKPRIRQQQASNKGPQHTHPPPPPRACACACPAPRPRPAPPWRRRLQQQQRKQPGLGPRALLDHSSQGNLIVLALSHACHAFKTPGRLALHLARPAQLIQPPIRGFKHPSAPSSYSVSNCAFLAAFLERSSSSAAASMAAAAARVAGSVLPENFWPVIIRGERIGAPLEAASPSNAHGKESPRTLCTNQLV